MDIVEYLNSINKDNANKFITSTSSNITVKRDIDARVSDTSWIDMVEECIPYLDNIIRNPRRFIVQEENIVQIEKLHKYYCGFRLFIVRLLYKLKLLKRT